MTRPWKSPACLVLVSVLAAFSLIFHQRHALGEIFRHVNEPLFDAVAVRVSASLQSASNTTSLDNDSRDEWSRSFAERETGPDEESFSACLLVMDDNHRLTEWISYHYFAMPMRYLVVAVDPHSKTSPTSFLDRWRDRITIVEWTDTDFAPNATVLRIQPSDAFDTKKNKHRHRQGLFYHACIEHLQRQNRTWTSFHDVDEYMTINMDVVDNAKELFGKPGSILQMVQKYSQNAATSTSNDEDPDHSFWYEHFQQGPCVTIARSLYSVVESTEEDVFRDVPALVNARQFDTLNWRYRANKRTGRDGLAKSIIDVSRVKLSDFRDGYNAHRPLRATCPSPWHNYNQLPLGIHQYVPRLCRKLVSLGLFLTLAILHSYLSSWASYSFREDARKGAIKSHEKWLERASLRAGGADDEVRPWISGFVNLVGKEVAKNLLQDAGLPENYTAAENFTASRAQGL